MIKTEIINGKVFLEQRTYYIYRNKEDQLQDNSPLLITSNEELFDKHKHKHMEKTNKHDEVYHDLLEDIVSNGIKKKDRTGTGTTAVFARDVRFNMGLGFPLLTTKKMYTKGIIYELLWFLGSHMNDPMYSDLEQTNIKYLVDNNCNIWNEWAFDRAMKITGSEIERYSDDWHTALADYKKKIKEDKEYARKYGNLGPVYGKQWVDWETSGKDIDELYEQYLNDK